MQATARALAALTSVALIATACASPASRQHVPRSVPRTSQPATSTAGATAGGNRQLARAEAFRLVLRTPLPPAHRSLGHAPQVLSGPAMGSPQVASLIDNKRVWRVELSYPAAQRWLSAHRPAGLTRAGRVGDVEHPGSSFGYSYDDSSGDRASAAWTGAELDIGVAPAGAQATFWRVDGLVEWLDPRPLTDARPGRRIHVAAAAGCPAGDLGVVGVRNSAPALSQSLLPAGNPTAVLLCNYAGVDGRAFTLAAHRLLGARAAGGLAQQVRAIALSHVDGGVTACAAATGSVLLLAFAYRQDVSVDLWASYTGCPTIANGSIAAAGLISVQRFESLVDRPGG